MSERASFIPIRCNEDPSLDKGKNNKDVVSFDDDLLTTSTFNGWPNGSISIFVIQRAPGSKSIYNGC